MVLHIVKSTPAAERSALRADALDELYDAYAPAVTSWARRLAGPTADIEDMVHDVFVVALRRGFTFQGNATVKTWLFRITHRVVRNRIRRTFTRGRLLRRREEEIAGDLPAPLTPHQEVERREEHQRLYRALDRLPEHHRTAVILYDIEGLSSNEVAELTGASVGTVWVWLHRARIKLHAYLTGEKKP